MQNREQHRQETYAFLQKHFSPGDWELIIPATGCGTETYFAFGKYAFFVKLGGQAEKYQAMAAIGLSPPVLAAAHLADGTSILVQPCIIGRKPSWADYCTYLEQIATIVHQTHHSPEVRQLLPPRLFDTYHSAALESLGHLKQKWEWYQPQVSAVSDFVEDSFVYLAEEIQSFSGAGLINSHNDICNSNWLITPDDQIYLLDFESMSLEDPACDVGALTWWYYPPEDRQRFLEIAGYGLDEAFRLRMRVRMAMHSLNILLPRVNSFDSFHPDAFMESLQDFRAILAGKENPRGYAD